MKSWGGAEMVLAAMNQARVPAEYGEVLRMPTATTASGRGSAPNDDVLTAAGTASIRFANFAAITTSGRLWQEIAPLHKWCQMPGFDVSDLDPNGHWLPTCNHDVVRKNQRLCKARFFCLPIR